MIARIGSDRVANPADVRSFRDPPKLKRSERDFRGNAPYGNCFRYALVRFVEEQSSCFESGDQYAVAGIERRGECGIERPEATIRPEGTSIRMPSFAMPSRQPLGVLVAPSAVA